MKNLSTYVLLPFLSVILVSCVATEINEIPKPVVPKIDKHHSIVVYPDGTTEAQKDIIRQSYPIKNTPEDIKKCSCGSSEFELWTWDYDNSTEIQIEGSKDKLVNGSGNGGVEGDPNFEFTLPEFIVKPAGRGKVTPGLVALIDSLKLRSILIDKPAPGVIDGTTPDNKVNIAIVDSGINFFGSNSFDPFLMDTSSFDNSCANQVSGWNFIDGNEDVLDYNGHGSYVTGLISTQLQAANVEYRILPVRIFDENGYGSYWDMICAFNYIRALQEHTNIPKIHLVNASFGYTFGNNQYPTRFQEKAKQQKFLRMILNDVGENALIVTSSGNVGQNNDTPGNEHYLSQWDDQYIIGVGGYKGSGSNLTFEGNYGPKSIELGAPYSGYKYKMYEEVGYRKIKPSGTSYGAAYTTSILARFIDDERKQEGASYVFDPIDTRTNFLQFGNGWIKRDDLLIPYFQLGTFVPHP